MTNLRNGKWRVYSLSGASVAWVVGDYEQNARLIAAAPALLAACRLARPLLAELDAETSGVNMHEVNDTIGRIDAAIALAEGTP